jgi:hypothetical protein
VSRRRRLAASAAAAVVAAIVSVVLLTGGGSRRTVRVVRPAPAPPVASEQLGANVNRLFNDGTYSLAQIGSQLAALRATGATLARSDALWEATEPGAPVGGVHRYRWRFDDEIAEALASHGLRWLPIVDYSAPWAQSLPGRDHSGPSAPLAYAAYAGALAARYGAGGTFWREHPRLPELPVRALEIWNEPDNPVFWVPQPDPLHYAQLYLLAHAAIHTAVPGAIALIGGLSNPQGFLPAMLAAEPQLRGRIDGVAIHPYAPTPAGVLGNVVTARRVLDALRLGSVPLWVTEVGWTTDPPTAPTYAPASARPGYVERTIAALGHSQCGVAATLLYTWVTPELNPANREDWFGISPPAGGGGGGPDVSAFAAGIRAARAVAPATACG